MADPFRDYNFRRFGNADYFRLRREIVYENRTVIVRTPSFHPESTLTDETDALEPIDGEF